MQSYNFTRSVPVEEGYDVLVAGGGPAGSAAAVCAARLGAKVLLVEATGSLGGMSTSGLVNTFGPMGDGERTLVGGFTRELIETMHERGFLGPEVTPEYWITHYNRWIPFDPEALKRLLDEYCVEAGVEIRYFTRVIDADVEGRQVNGAIISNVEGLRFIKARAFIDCTGDAVLAAACGAECKIAGRDWPLQPATVCSTFSGIDWEHPAYLTNRGTDAVREKVKEEHLPQANADGHFTHPDYFIAGMKKVGHMTGNLNAGHIYGLDGLSVKCLSEGMIYGRKVAVEYMEFYRKYVPGCERIELAATSPVMGVRDTRRIVGEFELTVEHYSSARKFPDQVAVYNRPADVHSTNSSKEEFERFMKDMHGSGKLPRGKSVGIPYSILVPRGWENLWVAGRCHSSDTKVHGSIRAQSAAFLMGQASATAAVQSMHTGQPACDLDTLDLVESLRAAGSYLPQDTLSRTMTRS
ncbi:MAG: FAD-dependent oxidoreductase [Rhizobiales bacterium]|nr:FAD-dependent oxidoreductase [Hyphomicrobiales bacterium]